MAYGGNRFATVLELRDSSFENDTARGGGGSLYAGALKTAALEAWGALVYARNCSFRGARAQVGAGGAVALVTGSTAAFVGCEFSGNAADEDTGGAISAFRPSINVRACGVCLRP